MKNLDDSLGFVMVKAARSMKRTLEIRWSEYNITSTQYTVLEHLWDKNGVSQSDLGKNLYFDNPTITGVIDRMVRDGLVFRRRDKNDRRVVKIYLSGDGRSMQDILPKIAEEVNKAAVRGFSAAEKKTIKNLAKKLWNNMSNQENKT